MSIERGGVVSDIEHEMERLARNLGGGWRMEHGVVPALVLTMTEAQAVEQRIAAPKQAVADFLDDVIDAKGLRDAVL